MNFKQIAKITEGKDLPQLGETGNGEPMVVYDGVTEDGIKYFRLEIGQDNNYMRNIYVYEDGTSEEIYTEGLPA